MQKTERTQKTGTNKKQSNRKPPSANHRSEEQKAKGKSSLCPAFGRCGGCSMLNLDYKDQLREKQQAMQDLLGKYGTVLPIVGMEEPRYYRCKVHHAFAGGRRGPILHGSYEPNSHRVVPTDHCLLEDEECQAIIRTIADLLKSFKIQIYDEDSDYGLLRHVMVRKGYATGEIMVVLVCRSPIFPSKNNFVKALRQKHPGITTVVQNVNDKATGMVLGQRNITLYGPGFIYDRLCGLKFRISPNSFYQVNPAQTEKLYRIALDFAGLTGKENVVDAYCGTGTIGLAAAAGAKKVIGVELNGDAVRDARKNQQANGITNAEFYKEDAGKFLTAAAAGGQTCDLLFMDPPRSGSTEQFMDAVAVVAPGRVVYISCGPDTLARDLAYFKKKGYRVEKIQPVDLFPYTEHVECVVLLSRKNS